MTSTRIYDIYPSLTKQRVNLVVADFVSRSPTSCYSFGYRTYRANSEFFRDCPTNCPVRARRTKGLPDISVLRWGSHTGQKDQGQIVSAPDRFENDDFTWSLSRSCDNHMCKYFGKWISLHKELGRIIAKSDSDEE